MKRLFFIIAGFLLAVSAFGQIKPVALSGSMIRQYNHARYWNGTAYIPLPDSAAIADTSKFLVMDSTGIQNNWFPKWNSTTHKLVFSNTLVSPAITTPTGIVKGDVGLGNVDNTSNATERTATATLTGKTIAAGSNTISGLTNSNLSGSAAISDANIASASTWNANLAQDVTALAYQALGTTILAETVAFPLVRANTAQNLADGTIRWVPVYLPVAHTITGINCYQITPGVYTADNNNRVGLYSYDGGTKTLTLVASSANNANVWKSTANTIFQVPLSTPYSAAKAIYYVALLANASGAFGTTPSLAAGTSLATANQSIVDFPTDVKLYGTTTGNNDLPSSILMSAITAGTLPYWVSFY